MTPSQEPFAQLQTELQRPATTELEDLSTLSLCKVFNQEEVKVSAAVSCCLPSISSFLDDLVPRVRAGGRLIYVGAGNSGRVAAMDCAELPVTFSADPAQFLAVVAGGQGALSGAIEGAEDDEADGTRRIEALQLLPSDTVIGISASGRTPFVIGALKAAVKASALTAGITNVYPSELGAIVTHAITALVGPELLAGSTRLKAGSAAKQILNMISTCLMVKLGKSYRGLMVDVQVKNQKLRVRSRNIVRQVYQSHCQKHGVRLGEHHNDDDAAIDLLIERCGGSVKLASAVTCSGLPPETAKARLEIVGGSLAKFLQVHCHSPGKTAVVNGDKQDYFLAVDGGGTNCSVSIATRSGVVARATSAGACNFNTVSFEELLQQIRLVTTQAFSQLPEWQSSSERPKLTAVWVGLAGLYHASELEALTARLEEFFNVSVSQGTLRLTSDGMLLSSCIALDMSVEGGIAVVAGTGSVAAAYKRADGGDIQQVGRAGGWGHILGDEGSAFDIGKKALQSLLTRTQQDEEESELDRALLARLGCTREDILSQVLYGDRSAKVQVSSLATVVTQLGFRSHPDPEAAAILRDAARGLSGLIRLLADKRVCEPEKRCLVLAGALMNLPAYHDLIVSDLKEFGAFFKRTIVVDDASGCAAQFLARKHQ